MAYRPDKLTKIIDPTPYLTARDVARWIAPRLDSDEIARTAQRVKHYARDRLIHVEDGGGEGPGRYRRYSDYSVFQAALVQEMKLSGVPVDAMGKAMARISEAHGKVGSKLGDMSHLLIAMGRWATIVHTSHSGRPSNLDEVVPVIYLVVNCSDGEVWSGKDLSQAPIGPAQFVFNMAAIFEKVRM